MYHFCVSLVLNSKIKNFSPLTHVKDKEAEGAKHDGSDLLPVDWETVPLRLVLRENGQNIYQNPSWSSTYCIEYYCPVAKMNTLFQGTWCDWVHQAKYWWQVVKNLLICTNICMYICKLDINTAMNCVCFYTLSSVPLKVFNLLDFTSDQMYTIHKQDSWGHV